MKFVDLNNIQVDLKQFEPDSLVIIRVTKKMSESEWEDFVKNSAYIGEKFASHGIEVVLCPDWIDFKEWK